MMVLRAGSSRVSRMVRVARAGLAAAAFFAALAAAHAQPTLNERLATQAGRPSPNDRLVVDAREIVYDNDRNRVSAVGDVQIHYQGRTLQADRVVYDRATNRVHAEGNARLTDPSGAVVTGDRFELTDDFKTGFIDSLRVTQSTIENGQRVTTRFSAPRAERIGGETTVFERGTYTACEPCAKDPARPPLWQVKAARIIHNNSERTIYYEDASLEFLGVPIAYVPYFWTPDPTVERKTGFLAPRYVASTTLGVGVTVPFYLALSPSYDLTLSPTFLSRQGVLGQLEWRHRLLNGSYDIRATGILQQDNSVFLPPPYGPGNREARGSVESRGLFHINERWKWGWDVTLLSDRWFPQNYSLRQQGFNALYFKDQVSTLFLQGQGDRSWFDLRGYYFQGLSTYDWQKQQPVVHPVFDYDRRFNGPGPLGGEVRVEANVTSLSREAAQYEQIPRQVAKYSDLFDTCSVFNHRHCLVRGISGTTSRASIDLSWRRRFIDGVGGAWTPFAYVRADAFAMNADFTGYQNSELRNFLPNANETAARLMPAAGLDYRFPLIASLGSATQILEPIAQVILRPNETRIGQLPNEDAQSLIFDDTSLFAWDKFSGYDRVEGGVRANTGVQYSVKGANGFFANALFGQSIHVAGVNSFSRGDLVNAGIESGLDSTRSDYVGRLQVSPSRNLTFLTRARFDEEDFGMKRFEVGVFGNFAPWVPLKASILYADYDAQPEIGYQRARQGVVASSQWNFTPNWFVSGSILVDLDRYLAARDKFLHADDPRKAEKFRSDQRLAVSAFSLGIGYEDECTILSVNYVVAPSDISTTSGERESSQSVVFRLELKTLGQASYRQSIGPRDEDAVADR